MISENNEDAYSLMIDKYPDVYYQKFHDQSVERDELIQEGTIGLINAINSYMSQDRCLFYTFGSVIIKREMARYVKKTLRNKQLILSMAVSFSENIGTDDLLLEDTLYDINDSVENAYDDKYYGEILYAFKFELTDLQAQIYELRFNNFSNKEISLLLDIGYKTVDNCLRIIKNKFKIYIQNKI